MIQVEIKTKEFKSYKKEIRTAKLKIGEKTYKIKQEHYIYYDDREDYPLRPEWYLTIAQMRNLLKAYPELWLVRLDSQFDGMTDCREYIEDDFHPFRNINKLIGNLKSYGFRVHYNHETKEFKLWSCVADYTLKFNGICELVKAEPKIIVDIST